LDDRHSIENFLLTGAEEDFCALFEVVYPRVRRYFLLRGMDAGEAEELAQDVMVIVYQRASEVREKEFFNGWLFKVAKNELARFWRRRQARKRIAEMEPLESWPWRSPFRSARSNGGSSTPRRSSPRLSKPRCLRRRGDSNSLG
jgi:DNA-directed RNA polymerase specialized sigma24 family protein